MTQKTWLVPLDEEGGISFPADLLKVMEWEDGTVLDWEMNADGSIQFRTADHQNTDPEKFEQQTET